MTIPFWINLLTGIIVLSTLAQNIMLHLKTLKDAHEKKRAITMNMCLGDFIAPELRFRSRCANSGPETPDVADRSRGSRDPSQIISSEPPTPEGLPQQFGSDQNLDPSPNGLNRVPDTSARVSPAEHTTPELVSNTLPIPSTQEEEDFISRDADEEGRGSPEQEGPTTEADHQRVFDRAVYLLREALDLHQPEGGGAVLFETNALSDSSHPGIQRHLSNDINGFSHRDSVLKMPRSYDPSEVIPGVGVGAARSTYSGKMRERVVLAAASVNKAGSAALSSNYGRADSAFTVTLTPPELQRMCKKHPRGKLFNIPDSVGTSLFDWEGRPIMGRLSAKLYELVLLRRQFPQAKQVIFIPMFHANLNRWTSCFAFSNSRFRIFTYEMDYLPTLSFCNLIRSEFARLGNIVADVQKNDFIGSVGHELRSPLHGSLLDTIRRG